MMMMLQWKCTCIRILIVAVLCAFNMVVAVIDVTSSCCPNKLSP